MHSRQELNCLIVNPALWQVPESPYGKYLLIPRLARLSDYL